MSRNLQALQFAHLPLVGRPAVGLGMSEMDGDLGLWGEEAALPGGRS